MIAKLGLTEGHEFELDLFDLFVSPHACRYGDRVLKTLYSYSTKIL